MKNINWRYINDSGAYYVHSIVGSDEFGDGTRQNPFRTIRQALNQTTKKYIINCIGLFSEMLSNLWYSSNWTTIRGDYYGAMTFDGNGENILYGAQCSNVIFKNCPAGTSATSVTGTNNTGLLAGVGISSNLNASNANSVSGVGGSSVLLHETAVYFGGIGGSSACHHIVYSKIVPSNSYKLWFTSQTYSKNTPYSNTVYDVPLANRKYSQDTSSNAKSNLHNFSKWIFAKCAMLANDYYMNYSQCLFTSDTHWYLDLDGTNEITYEDMDQVIADGNATNRGDAIIWLLKNTYSITDTMKIAKFTNCIFAEETSEEIFNNPEKQDFTLKYYDRNPAILNYKEYLGALPPSVNIPILSDSDGQTGCWDNRTASGCISLNNNAICVDTSSVSDNGHILSKVVRIDPYYLQYSGIYGLIYNHSYEVIMNINKPWGDKYEPEQELPNGKYIVFGGEIEYDDEIYYPGDVITISDTSESNIFESEKGGVLYEIVQPNIENVLYVRAHSYIYKHLAASDTLQVGGCYINDSTEDMTYNTRTIKPHDSFICDGETSFTANDYQVGVLFDDDRVPTPDWIPANAWGDYFVYKKHGVIQEDTEGVPISSGNSLSYQTKANGGYSDVLTKSIMNQEYLQFAIFVNKLTA